MALCRRHPACFRCGCSVVAARRSAPSALGLFGIALTVRILLSACEVPSVSLVPEITDDYDERTTLFRYRFLSGWMGGVVMMVLAYTVFMPGPERPLDPRWLCRIWDVWRMLDGDIRARLSAGSTQDGCASPRSQA